MTLIEIYQRAYLYWFNYTNWRMSKADYEDKMAALRIELEFAEKGPNP